MGRRLAMGSEEDVVAGDLLLCCGYFHIRACAALLVASILTVTIVNLAT